MEEQFQIRSQEAIVGMTVGAVFGGLAVGAALGYVLCPGEPGAVIGGVAFVATFGAGYATWGAYALAQAHASIFRLLLRPFLLGRKPTMDRAEWKEELGAMWGKALESAFLFWLNAVWTGALAAVAIAICADDRPVMAAIALYAAIIAYGNVLARLARRGYFMPPEG